MGCLKRPYEEEMFSLKIFFSKKNYYSDHFEKNRQMANSSCYWPQQPNW